MLRYTLISVLCCFSLMISCVTNVTLGDEDRSLATITGIDSVWFAASDNVALSDDVVATISGNDITATMPYGTTITSLKPTFVLSDSNASIDSAEARNFTNNVTYTVTAEDTTQAEAYNFSVTVAPPSSNKAISSVTFSTTNNQGLVTDITETVMPSDTTISIVTSANFQSDTLTPTFILADANATITNNNVSQDFGNGSVAYTVTAQDGTQQNYTLSVTITCAINRLANDTTLVANIRCEGADSVDFEGRNYLIATDNNFKTGLNYKDSAYVITTFVTDMSSAFLNAPGFSITAPNNVHTWDVSSVTDMSFMFGALGETNPSTFNQDISNWNTSNVLNMLSMFIYNTHFNQDIGSWNVSEVTNMTNMFEGATAFNQNLSAWTPATTGGVPSAFATGSGFDGNTAFYPDFPDCYK